MDVDAEAVGLVVFPVTLIDVTICMPELTLAISFVELPFTFIFGAIWPYLGAWTVPHSFAKISLIDCSVLKNKFFNKL